MWKCKKAPINPDIELQVANNIGAHHWREINGRSAPGLFLCLWCYDVKKFPTTFGEANIATTFYIEPGKGGSNGRRG